MPNWCSNDIKIYGNEGTIKALTNVIKSLNVSVNGDKDNLFQSLIGLPDGMTEAEYKKNWFNTNNDWFGTKWDVEVASDCFDFKKAGEILFFCETAWSPPIPFLVKMCEMYKLNAYIFYEEGGMGFSGETKMIWIDGVLSVEDNEYEYRKGIYLLSNEVFWANMDSDIEYAVEEDMTAQEFVEEFRAYASKADIQEIITMFNEQKKEYEERSAEVE